MSDEKTATKPKPVRGPNGQFVSTKKPKTSKKVEEVVERATEQAPEPITNQLPTALIFFDDRTYYGERIRRTLKDTTWLFVIEDLFPLANITDPIKIIATFKKSEYYKKAIDTEIFEVPMPKTNIGLSAITLASERAVLEFVNILRPLDHTFPGRFPEWLHDTAQMDYEEALLTRTQQLDSEGN